MAHPQQSIVNVARFFERQPDVLALILGGFIVHSRAGPVSDVDVMVVVDDEVWPERLASGQVRFFKRELCICPDGCVDGKCVRRSFLWQGRLRGSEPTRYEFLYARVLLSCPDGLSERPAEIARYPVAEKADLTRRFCAQFTAWGWYTGEAIKRDNSHC